MYTNTKPHMYPLQQRGMSQPRNMVAVAPPKFLSSLLQYLPALCQESVNIP